MGKKLTTEDQAAVIKKYGVAISMGLRDAILDSAETDKFYSDSEPKYPWPRHCGLYYLDGRLYSVGLDDSILDVTLEYFPVTRYCMERYE